MRRPYFPYFPSGPRSGGFACLVLVLSLWPGLAGAQMEGDCDVPSHGGLIMTTLTSLTGESRLLEFQTPVIRCPGGVTIRADSARVYEATNYNQLFGNVVFSDNDSRLTSNNAQYFADQRRLVASENPVLTDLTNGSIIRGDNITLLRAGPERDEDYLVVTGRRPHATLYPAVQPEPEADSVPADTAETAAPADTAAAEVTDSLVLPSDSTGVPSDSTLVLSDSTLARPDSSAVVPDTAVVEAPDTAVVEAPDTAVAEEVQPTPSPEMEEEPDPVPYEIDARQFILEGTRFFRATGDVIVTRDSLRAEADSLEYDQDEGALLLSQNAAVQNAGTDLAARSIRLAIPQDEIREAFATGDAVLVGEDLRLLAPFITLFFTGGRMERLVAVRDAVADSIYAEMDEEEREQDVLARGAPPLGARELGFTEFPRRPYAVAQDFVLEGDSVEVLAPGEILEEVKAMGGARGESAGRDTLNSPDTPPLISKDWLEGDTIKAFFREAGPAPSASGDSLAAEEAPPPPPEIVASADTTETDYQLDRLLALGGARSMYRMAPSDSVVVEEDGRLAVHYVVGDEITILLNEAGEAERMEVVGQTRGIHLEPIAGAAPVPDTSVAPDTSAVPDTLTGPDTLAAPDTLMVPGSSVLSGTSGVALERLKRFIAPAGAAHPQGWALRRRRGGGPRG